MWDAHSVYNPLEINTFACFCIWQHLPGKSRVFVSTRISSSQTHVLTWLSLEIFIWTEFWNKTFVKDGKRRELRVPRNFVPDFWPPNRKTSECKRESSLCFLDLSFGHMGVSQTLVLIAHSMSHVTFSSSLGKEDLTLPHPCPEQMTWGCVLSGNVIQFSSVTQSCLTLCDPMNCSTPGLPVHYQLPESTQTHVHWVSDAIQHLILCCPLLLLPPIPPSIRVFSNKSALRIRWPKYWSFSFNISPSNEHPGLISFRMDWLGLLAVQGTLKSLLQHHSSKASILRRSAFFTVQLSHPYMTTGKTIALTR